MSPSERSLPLPDLSAHTMLAACLVSRCGRRETRNQRVHVYGSRNTRSFCQLKPHWMGLEQLSHCQEP